MGKERGGKTYRRSKRSRQFWTTLFGAMCISLLAIPCGAVWAGEHKDLCRKMAEADWVIEVQYRIEVEYPAKQKAGKLRPPESVLRTISKTGVITQVLKGPRLIGQTWQSSWGTMFQNSGFSTREWVQFFERPQFRQVHFLKRATEGHWRSVGWAEEHARCDTEPQEWTPNATSHRSWCAGYANFKDRARGCLESSAQSVPIGGVEGHRSPSLPKTIQTHGQVPPKPPYGGRGGLGVPRE